MPAFVKAAMTPLCARRCSTSFLASTSYACSSTSSACADSALIRWKPPRRPKTRQKIESSSVPALRSQASFFPPLQRRKTPERSQSLNAVDSDGLSQGAQSDGSAEAAATEPLEGGDGAIELDVEVVDAAAAAAALSPSSTPTSATNPTPLLPVPWGLGTVTGVMLLWLLAFWSLGYLLVPGVLEFVGMAPRDALPPKPAAVVHLLLEAGELAATALVLWRALRKHRPRALGWFRADLGRPLKRWVLPLLLVVAAFPLVDRAAAFAAGLGLFPEVSLPAVGGGGAGGAGGAAGSGVSAIEAAIAAQDKTTCALYFAIVAVAAPLWEEAIFRGFLLASLTKHVSHKWAIAASSLVFATAHFAPQRVVPLLLLGLLFGTLYTRTKSLGAAVLAHSLWNVYIFAGLLLGRGAAGGVV